MTKLQQSELIMSALITVAVLAINYVLYMLSEVGIKACFDMILPLVLLILLTYESIVVYNLRKDIENNNKKDTL